MQYSQVGLIETIKNNFQEKGLKLVDTLEHEFHKELWRNIKEYMDNCSFAVALIDNFNPNKKNEFNANIFLEIGYLLALNKPILILIQDDLEKSLPVDVKPFIYNTFEYNEKGLPNLKIKVLKWIDSIQNIPGYLSIYLKKDYATLNYVESLKQFLSNLKCSIVSDQTNELNPDEDENLNYSNGISKIEFKTGNYQNIKKFKTDFDNNHYLHAKEITHVILKIEVSKYPALIDPTEGISFIRNSDSEEIVFCPKEAINGYEKEIEYAKHFFERKETLKKNEIEIVILKPFKKENGFLYVSNFKRAINQFPIKIYQGRKDNLPCLPISTMDILFMIITRTDINHTILSTNIPIRKEYLRIVNLHIDKVKYIIQEEGVPIEEGLTRNIKTFKKPRK